MPPLHISVTFRVVVRPLADSVVLCRGQECPRSLVPPTWRFSRGAFVDLDLSPGMPPAESCYKKRGPGVILRGRAITYVIYCLTSPAS